ncbi:MAG: dienelactone hydrolase family protein [Armatimonadetes bacterium]|nr:dienelactone hydrolase family protein [Armatimonadota bacterium]
MHLRTRAILIALLAALLPLATSAPAPVAAQEWVEVDAPKERKIRMAVVRPRGSGPLPVVVVLHGTEGFSRKYVSLAESFAREGFLAVAGCWFAGSHFGNQRPPDFIPCAQAPDFVGANLEAVKDVMALVDAVRKLPGARADRVGLFGHSRGAVIAVLVASGGGNVQAVVASAAHYTRTRPRRDVTDTLPITLVKDLQAPVLILYGTADELIDPSEPRAYEQALRSEGKTFESHAYPGAPHALPFAPRTRDDVFRRSIAFFKKHLGN